MQEQITPVNPVAPQTFTYRTTQSPEIIKKQVELLPLYDDKNPLLSKVTKEIDFDHPPQDLVSFAERLVATMNKYGGAGLAANQCGSLYRMFVMAGGIVVINPTILESSSEQVRTKEGCLTFPGLVLPVARPATIKVEYYTVTGEKKEEVYTGATAKVFQHEYDHLEGRVFTSRVGSLTLQMAKKKKQKLFKKIERIVEYKKRNGLK